jgi:hypothetical protein
MLELASVCEEVVNNIEDHLTTGRPLSPSPGKRSRNTRQLRLPPQAGLRSQLLFVEQVNSSKTISLLYQAR